MDEILGGLFGIGVGCWAWYSRYNKRAFIRMLRSKPKWTRMPLELEKIVGTIVAFGFLLIGSFLLIHGILKLLLGWR